MKMTFLGLEGPKVDFLINRRKPFRFFIICLCDKLEIKINLQSVIDIMGNSL